GDASRCPPVPARCRCALVSMRASSRASIAPARASWTRRRSIAPPCCRARRDGCPSTWSTTAARSSPGCSPCRWPSRSTRPTDEAGQDPRSEERRVGKEGGGRRTADSQEVIAHGQHHGPLYGYEDQHVD